MNFSQEDNKMSVQVKAPGKTPYGYCRRETSTTRFHDGILLRNQDSYTKPGNMNKPDEYDITRGSMS